MENNLTTLENAEKLYRDKLISIDVEDNPKEKLPKLKKGQTKFYAIEIYL